MTEVAPTEQEAVPAPPPMSDTGADAGSEVPTGGGNPRKRKKASRACDYCHTNHQPCDNGQPRCSVCEKHGKSCTYLRPTKRRGPQKGYRTALNTYKESAAAWGAILGAIPGLEGLIEGHLQSEQGRAVLKSVKDGSQQDALIQRWQDSKLFKTLFPNSNGEGIPGGSVAGGEEADDDDARSGIYSAIVGGGQGLQRQPENHYQMPSQPQLQRQQSFQQDIGHHHRHSVPQMPPLPPDFLFGGLTQQLNSRVENENFTQPHEHQQQHFSPLHDPTSLADIVANDAARSTNHASQTLAPLGFAPDETIADFYDMGANPEQPLQAAEFDFSANDVNDEESKVFYELLMGRSFS